MQQRLELVLQVLLWASVILIFLTYLKKCYVPYRPGKINVIMYDEDYHDAMIGIRGLKINQNGDVAPDESNSPKGLLWGLIPGRFYLYPFFKLKDDIELIITEKKDASLVTAEDQVISRNRSIAVVKRTVITNYLLYENTYYFGFKQLETGNDSITASEDGPGVDAIDFSSVEDPEIKKFSQQLNQLLEASSVMQSKIKDLENIDIEIAVADVVRITNVRKYLFQQKSWYPPKETLLKSAMREFCAERSYSDLIQMQTSTAEIVIRKGTKDILLARHLNKGHQRLNLGHKSLAVMLEEIDFGEESREIRNSLEEIQEAKRSITKQLYESLKDYIKLNLFSKKIGLVKQAILDIKSTANETEKLKWRAMSGKNSKITHYFGGNEKGDGGEVGIAEFQKLLLMFSEEEKKEVVRA